MPRFDGTGPAGMGPMTGGARGWCNSYGSRYAGYGPYRPPYPVPVRPDYAYGGLSLEANRQRPRWGLGRGFWGRGRGLALGRGWVRGRGRGWW
jgi:hypothetical protein